MRTRVKFKKLRIEKGFTQVKLSQISGVPPIDISNHERGARCLSSRGLSLIAAVLGVKLQELTEGE